jgi:hypothetical protein
VTAFDADDVSSGTSTRWRVHVSYNAAGTQAGLPDRLFAKTTTTFKQRLTLTLANIIEGESLFFRRLRPQIEMEAPYGYHGAVDTVSGRSISLLEDIVASKGAEFCTPLTPISRERMEDLLATMAAWHGKHWDDPSFADTAWLKSPSQHFDNLDRLVKIGKRARVGVKRGRSVIPDALAGKQDAVYRALERSLELATRGTPTLLHGDPHVGNTYVTSDGRMGYTDWQLVMQGLWAYDYAYAITSTLTIADRRAWEQDLLAFYLERLAATGAAAPDYEDAWLAYRQQSLYPYVIWLATLGHSAIQPKYQPDDVCLGIIERTGQAVIDLDAVAAVVAGSPTKGGADVRA